ncbi:MAG: hypothetical protein OYL97_09210 [Candidatus Poribacteria bacterium]|nr:hypothetical protein [Candidatus Poribacteria bacterium]
MKTHLTFGILILCALLVINVVNLAAEENWTRKADMPTQRSGFDTCVVNGKIYAIGGGIEGFGNLSVSTVEMYDPEADTWERKADMPTPRSNVSVSVVDEKIYAIGGTELKRFEIDVIINGEFRKVKQWEPKELPTVEMYDPVTDTWTQKADMPTPRDTVTCVVNGKIYAIGGLAFDKTQWRLDTVEVYDPATDTWAKAKSMNHARDGAAVSVVNGKIYVMGGTGWPQIPNQPGPFLSNMEVFNPKTNQWRDIREMSEPKASHSASVIDGKIYVIGGGFWGNGLYTHLSTIEIYDPKMDGWISRPDMPMSKLGHTSEVINGEIYIFGGHSDGEADPSATVEAYSVMEAAQSVNAAGKLLKTWATIKVTQ